MFCIQWTDRQLGCNFFESTINIDSLNIWPTSISFDLEPFSLIDDLLSSDKLTEEDCDFLISQLCNDDKFNTLSRKQRWAKRKKIGIKLTGSGYES